MNVDQHIKVAQWHLEQARLHNETLAAAIRDEDLPPFVYGGQDICGRGGPMVSMDFLQRVYFPLLRYSVEPLLDGGIGIVWHCDGDVRPILPLLLEMGVVGYDQDPNTPKRTP